MSERTPTNRRRLGDFAEKLVAMTLSKRGIVTMSEDAFDDEKDLTFNGHSVEVKARTRVFSYPHPNTFAIEPNQWKKIDSCAITIFLNVPMSQQEFINIYWLKDKEAFKMGRYNTGPAMRFYLIDAMEKIYTIKDMKIINDFYHLNFSKYKNEVIL